MHNFFYNVRQKNQIVREALSLPNNIRATAKKYKVQPCQIRQWRKNYDKITNKVLTNPKALTTNAGRKVENFELEVELNAWFEQMQLEDIPVKTNLLVAEAINLDTAGTFKQGDLRKINRWVYCFLERWSLSIRRYTRIGQKLSGHLATVKQESTRAIAERLKPGGSLENIVPHFFLNMDQTSMYFELKSKTVVAKKGARTVAVRVVTIAADGTKLPPFFIFKGQPGKKVEEELRRQNVNGCCQPNGWFDESVTAKYVTTILEPYVRGSNNAVLLVDHFKVHLMKSFVDACNNIGIDVEYIPAGYTCVLQPIDVGFNAQLKQHVRKKHGEWCLQNYRGVPNGHRLPVPNRNNVMEWVDFAFNNISNESIAKTFKSIGYVFPQNANQNENGNENENENENENVDIDDNEFDLQSAVSTHEDNDNIIEHRDLYLSPERSIRSLHVEFDGEEDFR
jgi:hypothetical protein